MFIPGRGARVDRIDRDVVRVRTEDKPIDSYPGAGGIRASSVPICVRRIPLTARHLLSADPPRKVR